MGKITKIEKFSDLVKVLNIVLKIWLYILEVFVTEIHSFRNNFPFKKRQIKPPQIKTIKLMFSFRTILRNVHNPLSVRFLYRQNIAKVIFDSRTKPKRTGTQFEMNALHSCTLKMIWVCQRGVQTSILKIPVFAS